MTTSQACPADSVSWLSLLKELVADPIVLALMLGFAFLQVFNASVLPALINREKTIEAEAMAANAAVLKQAEAAEAEQKSLTAAADAEAAQKKEAALARRTKAAALVAAAEAEIAAANAANAPVKASADAAAQAANADLTTQKALVEKEKAKQALRKLRAELETQQINIAISKINTMAAKYQLNYCFQCDPTYCLLCDKHDVPDLPSGAELPPLPDEPGAAAPPEPVVTKVIRDPYPWQANSPNDHDFDTWTHTLPYGALAAGGYHYSRLGFCSGKPDLASAKQCALEDCGYRNCVVVAHMTNAAAIKTTVPAAAVPKPQLARRPSAAYGTVVPIELNVHAGPNNTSAVVGRLVHGQRVEIGAQAAGDFIVIKATCSNGKSCDGYVNGRAEFIARFAPAPGQ